MVIYPVLSYENKEDTRFLSMKTIYCVLMQLFLNCTLSINGKTEGDSSVTSTGYITQTHEYSDDQRTTLAKSNISNTVCL
jgi:hypothetical protein